MDNDIAFVSKGFHIIQCGFRKDIVPTRFSDEHSFVIKGSFLNRFVVGFLIKEGDGGFWPLGDGDTALAKPVIHLSTYTIVVGPVFIGIAAADRRVNGF